MYIMLCYGRVSHVTAYKHPHLQSNYFLINGSAVDTHTYTLAAFLLLEIYQVYVYVIQYNMVKHKEQAMNKIFYMKMVNVQFY